MAKAFLWPSTAIILLLLVGIATVVAVWRSTRRTAPSNVVMISVDTLRAVNLGVYGYPRDTSPNLDRLAARSVLFNQAFTPWPKTTPAVASLMASQYGHSTGVMRTTPHQKVADRVLLLAEILRDHGFFNLGVVSNGAIGPQTNIAQGFDRYELETVDAAELNRALEPLLPELLERRTDGTPTFFWVHYTDPHAPYAPPQDAKRYVNDRWYDPSKRVPRHGPPRNLLPVDPTLPPLEFRRRVAFNRPVVSRGREHADGDGAIVADSVAAYDAEIRFVDTHIGRLLDRLEEVGLLDDSVLVFWADHGESLGEHNYYFSHGRFAYNVNLHVPLMLSAPGLEPGFFDSPVSLIDIAPTLLELLGIPIPPSFEGTSLAPALRGESQTPRDVFAEAGYALEYQKILVRWPWKLIHIPDPMVQEIARGQEFELYNLEKDPGEEDEMSARQPERLEEMRGELQRWVASWEKNTAQPEAAEEEMSPEVLENLRALGYLE
jgi:arylsulfatase A-like enzyme